VVVPRKKEMGSKPGRGAMPIKTLGHLETLRVTLKFVRAS